MLRVVCWKWKPKGGNYRSTFNAEHVNTLYRMVARNYDKPFEMVCFTDDDKGILNCIRTHPLWDNYTDVTAPRGSEYPSCYRRLLAFGDDIGSVIGGRFVSVDLDCVITGNVTELWSREEDFIIWSPGHPGPTYNGSMWMMNPGARKEVLERFDPLRSPKLAEQAGFIGSDQAWITYIVGDSAVWDASDGVYSWETHLRNRGFYLPSDAKIVFFWGHSDPWDKRSQERAPWLKEHYR